MKYLKFYRMFVWLWLLSMILLLGLPQNVNAQMDKGAALTGGAATTAYSYRSYFRVEGGQIHVEVVTFSINTDLKTQNHEIIDITDTCQIEGKPEGVIVADDYAKFDGTAIIRCMIPAWSTLFPGVAFSGKGADVGLLVPAFGAVDIVLDTQTSQQEHTVWSVGGVDFKIAAEQTHLTFGSSSLSSNPLQVSEPILAFSGVTETFLEIALWNGPDKFLFDQDFINAAQTAANNNAALAWVKNIEPVYVKNYVPQVLISEGEMRLYIGGKPDGQTNGAFTLYNAIIDPGKFMGG